MRSTPELKSPARLARYIATSFAITWSCWGLRAIISNLGVASIADPLPSTLWLVGGFGPAIGAIAALPWRDKSTLHRLFFSARPKTANRLIMFAVIIVATLALSAGFRINPNVSPALLPLIWLAATVWAGGNEEVGWRATMQPLLEHITGSWLLSTMGTGATWAIWHLPFWFTPGDPHLSTPFWAFALMAIVLSFPLCSLYATTGSATYCAILHGTINTFMSLFGLNPNEMLALGLIVLVVTSLWLLGHAEAQELRSDTAANGPIGS